MPPSDPVSVQLEALQRQFRQRLELVFVQLEQLALALDAAALTPDNTQPLFQQLHKLAGSAGSFGYDAISDQAIALYHQLGCWRDGGLQSLDPAEWAGFVQRIQALPELLPSAALHNAELAKSEDLIEPPYQGRARVWLVEDDPLQGQYLQHQLDAYGYEVTLFSNLAAAEQASQTDQADLLILDVLFDAEALDATQVLVESSPLVHLGCPLIFISAQDSFDSRIRAARLGAEGFYVKPLDLARLVNRVGYLIEERARSPERVLIVEDDLILARHYQAVLQGAGMQAEVLELPQRIVETVSTFRPDLILMDLHMPDYSGPELSALLRQYDHWASLSIVYLSAEADPALQLEAMRRRADDFILKPVSEQQLVAAVRVRVARARELNSLIVRDGLTGLLRHVVIKEAAAAEVARSMRTRTPVSLVMIDIDHFKRVNDQYGHAVGDLVISSTAMLLKQRLRQTDIVGRYGGEEFLVVLPDCDAEAAFQVIDALRTTFCTTPFSHRGVSFNCSFSAGIAVNRDFTAPDVDQLLDQADQMLYRAKREGRNRVMVSE